MFRTIFLLSAILIAPTVSSEASLNYTILDEGYTASDSNSDSFVIRDKESLSKILEEIKSVKSIDTIDFNRETIALIVSEDTKYPDLIKISDVSADKTGLINVYYEIAFQQFVEPKGSIVEKPYALIKIESDKKRVAFVNTDPNRTLLVNQSLDAPISYSNILKQQEGDLFLKYIPLDKGNSWTYEFEAGDKAGSKTFSIISFSNGWSVFDNFFGKINVGMRIDQGGSLFVLTKKGISPFYTDDVLVSVEKSLFSVKAGKFNDVLVVKSSNNSGFQFKDVYARDIGLIYHEHKSLKGSAKYELSQARVRGRTVP